MKRIFYTSAILGAAAFGLTGCSPTATNGNKAVINTNTNTAVATNSNANAAINSNAVNSSVNSNASVNMSKTLSSSDKEFMSKAAESGMAEALGISRTQLSNILSEKFEPIKSNVIELAEFLEVSPIELIKESKEK